MRKIGRFLLLLTVAFGCGVPLFAQSPGWVGGKVTDTLGRPLDLVNVVWKARPQVGATTDENGSYQLSLPAREAVLVFSCLGYEPKEVTVQVVSGRKQVVDVCLTPKARQLPRMVVSDEKYVFNSGVEHMDSKMITHIPAMSAGVEGLIKSSGLGVHANNELSSQYNVRGGSYDENLVYVNGMEVFRPFLIRSGQQEGLSFIHPDMVSSVRFSSGGFDAMYGDKMASVLDVSYKEPSRNAGSFSASLLGASAHWGGTTSDQKFSCLAGARYQSNAYMLKQMQTKGNYRPNFTDAQALLRYRPNERWKFSLFGNYARNVYRLTPETGEATIGNILTTIQRLTIYYDGQEEDAYQTLFGSFAAAWQCSRFSEITFSLTAFHSLEKETFDINAEYWLSDINMDFGSDQLGETLSSRSVGGELHHGRNFLNADIFNGEAKGTHRLGTHVLRWGLSCRREFTDDRLQEWYMYDSSFYSLPHPYTAPGDSVPFSDSSRLLLASSYLNVSHTLANNRLTAYVQDSWEFGLERFRYTLTYGLRASYATFNQERLLTPRLRFAMRPMERRDLSLYFATGWYYQPPLYKEMRTPGGLLNGDIRSQKSYQLIVGADYLFHWGERLFKLSGELYYKYLWDLVSYEVDNVRTIYSGYNDAVGFAWGADAKLSGELLPGLESWLSVSLLNTKEDLLNDSYVQYYDSLGQKLPSAENASHADTVHPGWLPRPTDQRFALHLFFQDEIPNHPRFKAHVNLMYATPLPYGIVGKPKALYTRRGKAYFRTDVGFSWKFLEENASRTGWLSGFKAGYVSLELLNMFNYYNVISYTAVSDIDGNAYMTPNYLTPRLYNLKIRFEF
ncbi:MAG: TonB-dependent receptor [Bacteroidales bacterium]|nr:TonB-dependent receptor [Bacteroidales bacterium]